MDSLHYKVLVIFVLFSIFCPLYATGAQFENGPTRIGSALNIYRGGIVAATRGRFYSKQDIFTGPNNIESGVTVWDTRTSFGLYWGMLDHLEIGVLPIISQKNHVNDPEIDVPGDDVALRTEGRSLPGVHDNLAAGESLSKIIVSLFF